MATNKGLVVGATGVIGSYLVKHLAESPEWNVTGVSRHVPESQDNIRYVSADLLDEPDCRSGLRDLTDITHIFYAAYQDFPADSPDQVKINLEMLKNVVTTMEAVAPNLRRIVLMEGVKAYGVHLGPFKTPAKETDPRHMPPNFYYAQEDFLRARQRGKSWKWTVMRPDVVCGLSIGNPMNIAMVIAVYAAISKQLNLPLRFPGKPGAYSAIAQVTDASLLAQASVWAALEEKCALEIFNVTNGDFFRWQHLWPKFAEFFGMELAQPQTIPLSVMMADKGDVWNEIVRTHQLREIPFGKAAAWPFGDFIFGCDYDVMSDTTKLRKFGFHDVQDSEEMFLNLLREFRAERIIP
jgi:nucleoside-diphosphate-sugar epimerase